MNAVLIAGSYSATSAGGARSLAQARVRDEDDDADEVPKGNLAGTRQDVLTFKATAETAFSGTFRALATMLKEGHCLPKREVVTALRDLFSSTGARWAQVYYSGHGTSSEGAWCFENSSGEVVDYLGFDEFLGLWRSRSSSGPKNLSLIVDCCHSGAWVDAAERKWTASDGSLTLRAACRANEVAFETRRGGKFSLWLSNQWLRGASSSQVVSLGVASVQHPQYLSVKNGEKRRTGS